MRDVEGRPMTIIELKRNNFETLSSYTDVRLAGWMYDFYKKYYPEDVIEVEVVDTIIDFINKYNVPDDQVDNFRKLFNKYIWAYSPRNEAAYLAAHDMHLI